jgi:lysine-specific demethylase 3
LQVSNQTDCIKIAYDFVHTESIPTCQKLTGEFHQENLVDPDEVWREDVLQISATIFYAYKEISRKCRLLVDKTPPPPPFDEVRDF